METKSNDLFIMVHERLESFPCSPESYRNCLKRWNSNPHMTHYALREKHKSDCNTSSTIMHSELHDNNISVLKTQKRGVKDLSNVIDKYDQGYDRYKPLQENPIVRNSLKPSPKCFSTSFCISSPKHPQSHSILLQEVVTKAQASDFNGLELADPVGKITKSFQITVPVPDSDFFEMI